MEPSGGALKEKLILAILALVTLGGLTTLASPTTPSPTEFDVEIGKALKLVDQAYRYGEDVSPYVSRLNKAVEAYEASNLTGASAIVHNVEENLSLRISSLRGQYESMIMRRNLVVGLLLAIPVISYFLIPYSYYTIWYKLRKDWLVEEAAGDDR